MRNYFKDLRNWYHIIVGSTLGYIITILFGFNNRENYPLSWDDLRTLLSPAIATIIVGFFAFRHEKNQDKIAKGSSDMRDVYVSMTSAYLGGVIALFYASWYIVIPFAVISSYLLIFKRNK